MGADDVTLQQFPSLAVEAYGTIEFSRLDRKLAAFRALPQADRDLLPEFEPRLSKLAHCIDANARLLSAIAASAESITATPTSTPSSVSTASTAANGSAAAANGTSSQHSAKSTVGHENAADEDGTHGEGMDAKRLVARSVRTALARLASDWSGEGAVERALVFEPVIAGVDAAFQEAQRAASSLTRADFRVLVPGAGAGRLAWELARAGFAVEGCEASFAALLAGNYVMNANNLQEAVRFFPFAHDHSNVMGVEQAAREVAVPDVNPKDIPGSADFGMRAGRFVDMYEGQDNVWDAVASCLASDVSESGVEHVRRVGQILKPGGAWVSIGPMACMEGSQGDGVHVSREEYAGMVRRCGFKVVKHEPLRCLFSSDRESLRRLHIESWLTVAVKVRPVP